MSYKISVIVPIYKVELYLHRCIDSVLSQTFTDFELILVDDGSPDRCPAICDEYLEKDNRIRVIHQQNGGLSAARNAALDIATGEYVTFIDSDDYVTEDYLEYLYNLLISNHTDVSVCDAISFEDGTEPVMDPAEVPEPVVMSGRDACISIYKMDGVVWVTAWEKLFNRQLFLNFRFPEGRIHEDNAIIPIVLYNARSVAVGKGKKYLYRINKQSITGKPFSLKRFDDIWAIENCMNYFKEKNDAKLINQAGIMKYVFNARNILDAYKAHISCSNIPVQYRMSQWTAWKILYANLPDYKFEWYLAQFHPKMALAYIYARKIKSLITQAIPSKIRNQQTELTR